MRDAVFAVLAVLAAVPLSACHDSADCAPVMMEEFAIDEFISAEQLDEIVADHHLPDREAISCERACKVAYAAASGGWHARMIDSCTLTLSPYPNNGGQVICTGTGYEHLPCP